MKLGEGVVVLQLATARSKTLFFFARASEEGWYNNANMLPHRASRDVYVVMLHAGLFNEAN